MKFNNIMVILGCVASIILLGLIFKISIWKIIKLIVNSILGGVLIYVINIVGASVGLHIGLNVVTSIIVGILGIPGALLILLISKIL